MGKYMSLLCRIRGVEYKEVPDSQYKSVRAYPDWLYAQVRDMLDSGTINRSTQYILECI